MAIDKSNRIFYYDIVRAFAIFCIISCHVFAAYVVKIEIFGTRFWYYSLFLNSLRDIGVPFFVMLSGILLINKKETFITFAKKRISRVVFPYLFWGFIFILCALLFKNYGCDLFYFSNINELIFNVFSINPIGNAVFLWFVPMIIIVYLIIFLINKINVYFPITLKISLILSILVIILLNFNLISFSHPYDYIFYSVFAIIGYFLVNIDFSKNVINSKYLGIIFAIIFLISYILEVSINASMSLSLNQFNSISQFSWINLISIISLFLCIRYISEAYKINNYDANRFSKIIFSISICSYGIYLSHIIVKHILLNFILCNIKNYVSVSIYSTFTLIFTFLCSWILILILNKIPYLRNISGAS